MSLSTPRGAGSAEPQSGRDSRLTRGRRRSLRLLVEQQDSTASTAAATNSGSASGASAQPQQIVAQASQRPTAITVTTPVGKTIPTGKKIVFISCGAAQCELQGNIIAQGAAELGWTSSTIATDGSPAQIQNAFNTALRNGANAVILNATLRAEIAPELAAAQAKGVPMVECCATDPLDPSVMYNTSTASQSATIGKDLGAEVVADSKAEGRALSTSTSRPTRSWPH